RRVSGLFKHPWVVANATDPTVLGVYSDSHAQTDPEGAQAAETALSMFSNTRQPTALPLEGVLASLDDMLGRQGLRKKTRDALTMSRFIVGQYAQPSLDPLVQSTRHTDRKRQADLRKSIHEALSHSTHDINDLNDSDPSILTPSATPTANSLRRSVGSFQVAITKSERERERERASPKVSSTEGSPLSPHTPSGRGTPVAGGGRERGVGGAEEQALDSQFVLRIFTGWEGNAQDPSSGTSGSDLNLGRRFSLDGSPGGGRTPPSLSPPKRSPVTKLSPRARSSPDGFDVQPTVRNCVFPIPTVPMRLEWGPDFDIFRVFPPHVSETVGTIDSGMGIYPRAASYLALPTIVDSALTEFDLYARLRVSRSQLWRCMASIQFAYTAANPYHNATHAADMTHMAVCLVMALRRKNPAIIGDLELFSLILATACHDVKHPALDNKFLVRTQHDIATRYNDRSVLENHHAHTA
ncbi:3'5'-cyclic nucleotide phosphodiesterase, partial [Kipferlia bialata]